jgi:hypothetical protein
LLEEAELKAEEIREEAELLAGNISSESAAYVADFVATIESRIKLAREQMDDMGILAQNLKSIVNGFDLGEISSSTKTSKYGEVVAAEIVED